MQNQSVTTIEEVIKKMQKHKIKPDVKLIKRVYKFAEEKHEGQVRISGEKYITHPLEVANIVAELGLDNAAVCAAILHDVVEDTPVTHEDIIKEFGEEIAEIVAGVTKLRKNTIWN